MEPEHVLETEELLPESGLPLDQVLQGDCLELLKTLPDESVDLVFADPPYNLQLQQELWRPNLTRVDAVDDDWDRFGSFAEYDAFTRAWLAECKRVLKRNGTLWVIGSYHNIFRVGSILQDLGYWILNDVAWIKCLAGNTELFGLIDGVPIVSTLKDIVRISPVEHRIELPSYDEGGCFQWVKVSQWQKSEKEVGIRINLEDGTWVECTNQHKFPVAREGKIEFIQADELTQDDVLLQLGQFHLPHVIQSIGIDRAVGEMIGWYLAEGSYLSEEKGITLSLSGDEKPVAQELIQTIQDRFGVVGHIHHYGNCIHLNFPGKFMMEFIRRFVRGDNAKNKRLTREAFSYGPQFLQGVLTGYLKGDGHWEEKTGRWRLGLTKNHGLIADLGVICRVLGYRLHFYDGFVPYKDAKVEVIKGEIRENLDGRWDYVDLHPLGLPSRRFFTDKQSFSLYHIRNKYKLVTRKSPDGVMSDLGHKVIDGDLRLVRIKSISASTQRTFYDVAVEGGHVFSLANGLLTHNSNPMPNFRGVRFTNAHETLLWAQKEHGAQYTFNYQAMKALNDGVQMRSDWALPICSGKERIKYNGQKAHPTQKPEALLYRVLLASSKSGDVVLDPFFGTGTTGAVARRMHRHFIGIERDPFYVQIARERISLVAQYEFDPQIFVTPERRSEPRVPFGRLIEYGYLEPGQNLYFGADHNFVAVVQADGSLEYNGERGSIHHFARLLRQAPANGWEHWYYPDPNTGELRQIDELRQAYRQASEHHLEPDPDSA